MGLKLLGMLIAFVPIILALFIRSSLQVAGFPDGHLTELNRALVIPYNLLLWLSLLVGCFFFYKVTSISEKKDIRNLLTYLAVFLAIFVICYFGFNYYFKEIKHLDYGQGG